MQDPKYLGIPNINFSLTSKEDKREELFKEQRLKRGFDDSETWSLTDTICLFIIPRLEEYQKKANGYLKREDTLVERIDGFLEALKLLSRDDGICTFTEEEEKQVERGLKAFPDIFRSLWR